MQPHRSKHNRDFRHRASLLPVVSPNLNGDKICDGVALLDFPNGIRPNGSNSDMEASHLTGAVTYSCFFRKSFGGQCASRDGPRSYNSTVWPPMTSETDLFEFMASLALLSSVTVYKI